MKQGVIFLPCYLHFESLKGKLFFFCSCQMYEIIEGQGLMLSINLWSFAVKSLNILALRKL